MSQPRCWLTAGKGGPVRKLELRSEDGRLLGPEDTLLLLATVGGTQGKV